MTKTPLTSLSFGLFLLAAPAVAGECDGTPGYHLDAVDSFVNGETLHVCLEAPPGQTVTILISANLVVTPSPYGNVCVDLFNGIVNPVFVMPPSGKACYEEQFCKPITEDSTFYIQFVAVDSANPSQAGVSNLEVLTIEASDCYQGTPPDDDDDCKDGHGHGHGKWGKDCDDKWGKDDCHNKWGDKWGKDCDDKWGGGHDDKWGKDCDDKWGGGHDGKWGKDCDDKWGNDHDDKWGGKWGKDHDDKWGGNNGGNWGGNWGGKWGGKGC